MCKDKKITFSLIPKRCSACNRGIEHWFWYKNGAYNHLKQKYVCPDCGLVFLPTPVNQLAKGEEERFKLANFLFEETKIMKLLNTVPVEDIYSLSENKEIIKVSNNDFYNNFLTNDMEVNVSKDHVFQNQEKLQIFIPNWNYMELYIPKKYLQCSLLF